MNKKLNQDLRYRHRNVRLFVCLFLFIIISSVPTAYAYHLNGYSWPQPSTTFYVDIPGANGLWNEAFEGAMYEWGVNTIFQFYIIRGTYSNPCNPPDDRNGVGFDSTYCGEAWGGTTLAITHTWYIGATIIETDIVFNSNKPWNVYSGPWSYSVNDFRRIAVHELGHALGLGHEDSGVSTIMVTYAGDNEIPQQDDINGIAAIYGGGSVYYRDYDYDGYGNPNNSTTTTSQPPGYVSNSSDCNDYDSSIHPGATEIRGDGIDQDCNGSDLPSLNIYYQDYDGDGYGNPNNSTQGAYQPSGYVTNHLDCNDYDSSIHPEATEGCNGVDDNCDGIIDEGCYALPGFDKIYYLAAKLAALQASDSSWIGKNVDYLETLLFSVGFTAESHYSQYGYKEGLTPNAYFKHYEYIHAKATAMYYSGGYPSVEAAQAAFNAAWPYDAYQHYLQYGAAEGINPSNSFDESAYLTDKLAALRAEGSDWDDKTIDDLRGIFASYGMTVLDHYMNYGAAEGLSVTPVPGY